MHLARQCFGLSDQGIEDAIYDSQAIRAFVGIDLAPGGSAGRDHAVEVSPLAGDARGKIFEGIKTQLAEKGLMMREGIVVDVTLIAALCPRCILMGHQGAKTEDSSP